MGKTRERREKKVTVGRELGEPRKHWNIKDYLSPGSTKNRDSVPTTLKEQDNMSRLADLALERPGF